MKRLILNQLLEWKKKPSRKPLILQGARQVGKTWILQEFGKLYFNNVFHLDFEKDRVAYLQAFEGNLSPETLLKNISLITNRQITPDKDLIIFDEIQNIPKAITSLKYFYEDMPQLAICAAGSLLGINFSESAYPVGKVEHLTLHPMNFEEFLLNYGNKGLYESFLSGFENNSISSLAHEKLLALLKEFYITGGMPEVLNYFLKYNNENDIFDRVRNIQKELIISYMRDIYKHSGKTNSLHIESVFNNIPVQLAETVDQSVKRYRFKDVISGKKGYTELQGPIDWLLKAGLVNKVHICNRAELPFKSFCKENVFKLYLFDIGILGTMLELPPSAILLSDYAITKGYFVENFAITEIKSTHGGELYSWNERNSEIEILANVNSNVIPIEVKSGTRTKTKSLQQFISKYNPEKAYVISEKMFSTHNEVKQNIPLYYITKLWKQLTNS